MIVQCSMFNVQSTQLSTPLPFGEGSGERLFLSFHHFLKSPQCFLLAHHCSSPSGRLGGAVFCVIPRKSHQLCCFQSFLAVRLHAYRCQHPHSFPSTTLVHFLTLVVLFINMTELFQCQSAKIFISQADTTKRNA